jgi:hypothetical protein
MSFLQKIQCSAQGVAHMEGVRKVGDIELDQDLPFESRQQKIQRASWLAGLAIIVAAALGAFGNGYLSRGYARSADGALTVRYERLARNEAPGTLTVELQRAAMERGQFVIAMPRDYFDSARLRHIVPQPLEAIAAGDEMHFRFSAERDESPARIFFEFEHRVAGRLKGAARLLGPKPTAVSFSQFIYP